MKIHITIAYQIKDHWKSFPTVGHMHQSELKRRSYDALKNWYTDSPKVVPGRGASK